MCKFRYFLLTYVDNVIWPLWWAVENGRALVGRQQCVRQRMFIFNLFEGRERVKWKLGFALFFAGKMGLTVLGLGYYQWEWD